jgi:hypothetical protein
MTAAFILLFLICPADGAMCEEGHVAHRTCAAAEAYMREGLQDGQSLHVTDCVTVAEFKEREKER